MAAIIKNAYEIFATLPFIDHKYTHAVFKHTGKTIVPNKKILSPLDIVEFVAYAESKHVAEVIANKIASKPIYTIRAINRDRPDFYFEL